jgi:ABC-type nitrate/sulfonate/bicarbonate transport system substrate-binding protein
MGLPKQINAGVLRVGFVPLCDCAPLVIARETGLFKKYGLRVELSREIGWASLRDKILYGELDAAHALAPMVFTASLGLESARVPCLTGLVLNLHGNAVTLASSLFPGELEGPELREQLLSRAAPLVIGIPFLYSAHHFVARAWLRSLSPQFELKTQFVVVPPPQMPQNLRAGHLDAYCVGEPWNSLAVLAGFGRIAETSARIAPLHPEKVLMVRTDFAQKRSEEHELLIAALLEACRYCDDPQNRGFIIETLQRREYLNVPSEALRVAFGAEALADQKHSEMDEDFTIFWRDNANEPSAGKAAWVLDNLCASGLAGNKAPTERDLIQRSFRTDIFERALCLAKPANSRPKHEIDRTNEIFTSRL